MELETKIRILMGVAAITFAVGPYSNNYFRIGRNLEPNAILCHPFNNLRPPVGINLPIVRNMDLDRNGKYESALFYKDSQGKTVYQEIIKNEDDKLVFREPKFYK
jgi:hypothetical protein